jgi:hypothetical protein
VFRVRIGIGISSKVEVVSSLLTISKMWLNTKRRTHLEAPLIASASSQREMLRSIIAQYRFLDFIPFGTVQLTAASTFAFTAYDLAVGYDLPILIGDECGTGKTGRD